MNSGSKLINVALFSSGNGTNAEALIQYFENHTLIKICAVFVNKQDAGVIARANRYGISVILFNKDEWNNGFVLKQLQQSAIDYILLAGFFWLVPNDLIQHFPDHILNIHPSLLPKYGGKGMYGIGVHEAVLKSGEKMSGITIHLVNEDYDSGTILFQKELLINPGEDAVQLAVRVNELEKYYYPRVAEIFIISGRNLGGYR
jgi:phosphoribosylglycinamide formyltransferase-1